MTELISRNPELGSGSPGPSGAIHRASEEEQARARTSFPGGSVDLGTYVADHDLLARYRRKQANFAQYASFFEENIKLTFTSIKKPSTIFPEELHVLDEYRSTGANQAHYDWVAALWENDSSKIGRYEPEIKTLASALNRLHGHTGTTYRFVDLPSAALERYREGELIFEPSFISSSKRKRDLTFDFSNTFFEFHLKGENGHDIEFSQDEESEVLINANTAFQVVSVKDAERPAYPPGTVKKYTYIVLEEIPRSQLGSKLKERSRSSAEDQEVTPRVRRNPIQSKTREIGASLAGLDRTSIPRSLWGNEDLQLYFYPDHRVDILGRNITVPYSIVGSEVVIDLPNGPLRLKQVGEEMLIGPNGSVFSLQ